MLLGKLFRQLEDEEIAAEALLSLGDIVLLAGVEQARAAHGETVGEYVSGAASRFSRLASDEEWLRLMTALERSETPAQSCLATIIRWSIASERANPAAASGGCSCAGAAGGCHGGA